jgi:uncharacterized protein YjbI with pentapeptide repeats
MPLFSETVSSSQAVKEALNVSDEFYRYCEFSSASLDGGHFDGVFVSCSFKDIDWYWALFNTAVFVDCEFENCAFRGASFASCRIVNCTFKNCRFLRDNLDGLCSAPETSVYGCQSENCEGFNELFANRVP